MGNALITGAAGYIGQAVSQQLLSAGWSVYGLVRSDVAAGTVAAQGVNPVRGDLDALGTWTSLDKYDVVIDTASADHTPSTEALIKLLQGTGKKLIRTSGTGVYTDLGGGAVSDVIYREEDPFTPADVVAERVNSDLKVIDAANRDVHSIVIRPSMIFGDGASEQLPLLIRNAISTGTSVYAGEGRNRWANVHLRDLARVYLLALEKAPAGSVYNIAAGELEMRQIATGIGELTRTPVHGVPLAEAHQLLGERWVDVALASNSRVDSSAARRELGWEPIGPALLDDLVFGSYKRLWSHKGDPHDHQVKNVS